MVISQLFTQHFSMNPCGLVGVAVVVIWADRRFNLGHGRAFALYVVLYTAGRVWIEALRIDSANEILGLRLNIWTSIIVGLGSAGLPGDFRTIKTWTGTYCARTGTQRAGKQLQR